jgi:hypothetical protein
MGVLEVTRTLFAAVKMPFKVQFDETPTTLNVKQVDFS